MWKVLRLPMEFFSQRMAGDIQERQESNAVVAASLINTVSPLILQTGMMVIYLVLMIRISPLLSIIGVASILINVLFSRLISAKRVNITRVLLRDMGKLQSTSLSGIEMIETIKASGAEEGFFEKWSGYQASVNRQNVNYIKLDHYLGMLPTIVTELSAVFVLLAGISQVMAGSMTPGMVMAFQGLLTSFTAPATMLISAGQTLQEMRSDMERIDDVMEYPEDIVFSQEPVFVFLAVY